MKGWRVTKKSATCSSTGQLADTINFGLKLPLALSHQQILDIPFNIITVVPVSLGILYFKAVLLVTKNAFIFSYIPHYFSLFTFEVTLGFYDHIELVVLYYAYEMI